MFTSTDEAEVEVLLRLNGVSQRLDKTEEYFICRYEAFRKRGYRDAGDSCSEDSTYYVYDPSIGSPGVIVTKPCKKHLQFFLDVGWKLL